MGDWAQDHAQWVAESYYLGEAPPTRLVEMMAHALRTAERRGMEMALAEIAKWHEGCANAIRDDEADEFKRGLRSAHRHSAEVALEMSE